MRIAKHAYPLLVLLTGSSALTPLGAYAANQKTDHEAPESEWHVGVVNNETASKYRLGRHTIPEAYPADSYYFLAELNQYTFIGAFYVYNGNCVDKGPPTIGYRYNAHGTLAYGPGTTVTPSSGQCAGHTYNAVTLYYQWTDASYSSLQDYFQIDVTGGTLPAIYDYVASIDATTPDKELGKPQCPCGDPIDVASGNVYESATDYESAGQNDLLFTRSYNSLSSPATMAKALGQGWRSNFDRYLQVTTVNGTIQTVVAERPDGQMLRFTQVNGIWTPDSDVSATLSLNLNTWTLVDSNDTTETYTGSTPESPQLTQIVQRGGYTMNLAYNTSGQLTTITDLYDRTLTLGYTGSFLSSVTTPDNLTIQYGVTNSLLTTVTFPTSPASTITYQYGTSSFATVLTGILDENSKQYASWTYDAYSRGTSSSVGGGLSNLTTVTYNDSDGSRVATNALGVQDTYSFSLLQGVPKVTGISRAATSTTAAATEAFTYDANGYRASATDWNGNLTTYVNDVRGDVTQMVEASGTSVARTTNTAWDANFHVPDSVATQGITTSYSYDGSGNPTVKTDTASGLTRTWTTAWANALPASITGPRTDVKQVTQFTYGAFGALSKVKDAAGHITQIPSSTASGLPLKVVDPNGVTTTFGYDQRQRLLMSSIATAAGALTTSYAYDATGNLLRKTLPDGSYDAKAYDQAHRLVADGNALGEVTSYSLDALGDRLQTTIANKAGQATAMDSASFDALGRKVVDKQGAGQTTMYAYDPNGNVTGVSDPKSLVTAYAIDALDRVAQAKDPAKGLTTYSYDAHDRILQLSAPNGASTGYVYDGFGRKTQQSSPDTGMATYSYDLADNQTSSTDGAGVVTTTSFDALNRPTAVTYPSDTKQNVALAYDQSGHGFGIGHLTAVTDAVGKLSLSYDERGNRLSEARVNGTLSLTTSYAYDAASRMSGVTYPFGTVTGYARDAAGQVTSVMAMLPGSTTTVSLASGMSWQPSGPLATLTYGNGIAETRSYDGSYRLLSLVTGSVQSLTYGYDADDNATSIADGVNKANSQSLGYDTLNRLTSASGSYGSQGWTYDAAGNRLTQTAGGVSTSYSYAANSNVLSSYAASSTTSLSYNGNGAITGLTPASGNATTLAYNGQSAWPR